MVGEFMVKNYRNISVDRTMLSKLNILIGPNGSGKSNFLRDLGFFAKVVQNKPRTSEGTTALYETVSQNGWNRMLNFNALTAFIDFSWVLFPEGCMDPCQYKLKVHIGDNAVSQLDFYVASEFLAYDNPHDDKSDAHCFLFKCHGKSPGVGYFATDNDAMGNNKMQDCRKLTIRNNEIAFLQLDELRDTDMDFDKSYRSVYAERTNGLSRYLSRFFTYSCSEFSLNQIKKPANSGSTSFLAPDASNLANLLQQWRRESYDTTFSDYRAMITPLFGELHPIDIIIDPIPGTAEYLLGIGIRKQKYLMDDLSDGTIRAMIMAALLVDRKEKMSVCTIDEPEMNLHPEWQSRFSDWLLRSKASQQFFVSTHSPEILDPLTSAFMDGELKVFVFSDAQSIVELAPNSMSELYNKGFNLGDLYRAKAIEIGGWPR